MINPATLAAMAMASIFVLPGGGDALAQSRLNERANERAIVPPLPPMRTRPGVIVGPIASPIVGPIASPIVGPIGSPNRSAMPPPVPNHPFDHDHEPDHARDRERGAFAAGVAAGVAIGGAVVAPPPGVYYAPMPSPVYDPVGYCTWMYSSYDPQSGTYIGDDGNPHPCPP